MKRRLYVPIVFAAYVAFASAQAPAPLQTEYYPLKKGHRWTYRVTDSKAAQPKKAVMEVEREEVYTRTTKKDKAEVQEPFTGYLVKMTSGGKTAIDHVVVMDAGIHRVHTAGTPANPPIQFFKLPLKAGDQWPCNSMTGNTAFKGTFTAKNENIGVPAGKHDAILISYRDANSTIEIDSWFVRGIGMIKQRVKLKNSEVTLELEDFTPAK